jgi:uncharacterized protein
MGRVVHFEIHADDTDRAERFYTEVFGWRVEQFDGPVDHRLLKTGDRPPGIDGAIVPRRGGALDGSRVVSAFVCTVEVDDVAKTEEGVLAAGGEHVVERQNVEGVGELAYFKDTEGNIFGVMRPARKG